jgi:hypothetical protein
MAEERQRPNAITESSGVVHKGVLDKFKDNFIKQDIHVVKDKLVDNVLIPSIKRIISDTISNGIDMILYGEVQNKNSWGFPNSSSGFSKISMIPYNSIFEKKKPMEQQSANEVYEYGRVTVASMEAAKDVIRQMREICDLYHNVRVADLYDLVKLVPNGTDNRYGWTDFSTATFRMLPDGRYLIVTPPVELLQTK